MKKSFQLKVLLKQKFQKDHMAHFPSRRKMFLIRLVRLANVFMKFFFGRASSQPNFLTYDRRAVPTWPVSLQKSSWLKTRASSTSSTISSEQRSTSMDAAWSNTLLTHFSARSTFLSEAVVLLSIKSRRVSACPRILLNLLSALKLLFEIKYKIKTYFLAVAAAIKTAVSFIFISFLNSSILNILFCFRSRSAIILKPTVLILSLDVAP